jgi:hypothetical protein
VWIYRYYRGGGHSTIEVMGSARVVNCRKSVALSYKLKKAFSHLARW